MVPTVKASTIKNSIQKARKINPRFVQVDTDYYACPSEDDPETGYLLEVGPRHIYCPCPGYEHQGMCYHRMALALKLDMVPEAWLRIAADDPAKEQKQREHSTLGRNREPLTSLWS